MATLAAAIGTLAQIKKVGEEVKKAVVSLEKGTAGAGKKKSNKTRARGSSNRVAKKGGQAQGTQGAYLNGTTGTVIRYSDPRIGQTLGVSGVASANGPMGFSLRQIPPLADEQLAFEIDSPVCYVCEVGSTWAGTGPNSADARSNYLFCGSASASAISANSWTNSFFGTDGGYHWLPINPYYLSPTYSLFDQVAECCSMYRLRSGMMTFEYTGMTSTSDTGAFTLLFVEDPEVATTIQTNQIGSGVFNFPNVVAMAPYRSTCFSVNVTSDWKNMFVTSFTNPDDLRLAVPMGVNIQTTTSGGVYTATAAGVVGMMRCRYKLGVRGIQGSMTTYGRTLVRKEKFGGDGDSNSLHTSSGTAGTPLPGGPPVLVRSEDGYLPPPGSSTSQSSSSFDVRNLPALRCRP